MRNVSSVDRLEVLVLVDNITDSLSSNPGGVTSEWIGLLKAGRLPELSGRCTCCAHHGLSLLLTAHVGSSKRTVLFDTGPDTATFTRNAEILGVDWSAVEAVVLSHGHWDHAGALTTAIDAAAKARTGGRVDCFVHPGMFDERAIQLASGAFLKFEDVPSPDALTAAGAHVVNTREPQAVADGAFYLSGEIPRVSAYESGLPGHMRRRGDDQSWEPDPLIMDERFLSVHVKDKGQFIFTACSHAGVVNVVTHARSVFPSVPVYGVMGGFHLSGATEKIIPETVADLKQFGLRFLAPGHCTGWRAVNALAKDFDGDFVPTAVGKRYVV